MGCGPLKGKERKNATVAQELLSEETLQQLLKQEELWQLQNRKRNKENCIWTHLVVAAASWRVSYPSNLVTASALPCPWFKQGLERVPAAAPPALPLAAQLSAGQTTGSQTVCGRAKWCWDFTIFPSCSQPENLQGCISLFLLLEDKIKHKLRVAVKTPIVTAFWGFSRDQVEISGSFHHVTQALFTVLPIAIVSWAYGN